MLVTGTSATDNLPITPTFGLHAHEGAHDFPGNLPASFGRKNCESRSLIRYCSERCHVDWRAFARKRKVSDISYETSSLFACVALSTQLPTGLASVSSSKNNGCSKLAKEIQGSACSGPDVACRMGERRLVPDFLPRSCNLDRVPKRSRRHLAGVVVSSLLVLCRSMQAKTMHATPRQFFDRLSDLAFQRKVQVWWVHVQACHRFGYFCRGVSPARRRVLLGRLVLIAADLGTGMLIRSFVDALSFSASASSTFRISFVCAK